MISSGVNKFFSVATDYLTEYGNMQSSRKTKKKKKIRWKISRFGKSRGEPLTSVTTLCTPGLIFK